MTVSDDTKKATDQYWRTAREIHKLIGCWGFTSVRRALNEMAESGIAEARRIPHRNGEVIEYREARRS
jgi:hypothetical protein